MFVQTQEEGLDMIRKTHRPLFERRGSSAPVAAETWSADGWKAHLRGSTETSLPPSNGRTARLRKWVALSAPSMSKHAKTLRLQAQDSSKE
jgi:hypothetical protein